MGNSKLGLDISVGSSYINSVVSKRAVTTNRFHSDTRYRRRVISALRNSSAELVTTHYAAFVYRLGHSPFKARRRVRFPQAVLQQKNIRQWPNGEGSGLIYRRCVGSSPTWRTWLLWWVVGPLAQSVRARDS